MFATQANHPKVGSTLTHSAGQVGNPGVWAKTGVWCRPSVLPPLARGGWGGLTRRNHSRRKCVRFLLLHVSASPLWRAGTATPPAPPCQWGENSRLAPFSITGSSIRKCAQHLGSAWSEFSKYCLAICLFASFSAGISRAQDEIHYYDRSAKSIVAVQANVEQENAGGIRFRTGSRVEPVEVPAQDLIDIVYSVPGSLRLILARARNAEKKSLVPGATQPERLQAIAEAIKEYEQLLKESQQGSLASARRHWQFRIARLRAQAASENPAEFKGAVGSLKDCASQSDSWQAQAASRLLANLHASQGDFEAAAQACRQTAGRTGGPAAIKREQMREAILWDILGKNTKQATAAMDKLRGESPATGGELLRLQALRALRDAASGKPEQALSQLEQIETQCKDPADRGLIWLLRGHCEAFAGRDDQALWAMLRVDLIHSEDRIVDAQALEQITKLFESRSDWAKAARFRCKLWRDFAG